MYLTSPLLFLPFLQPYAFSAYLHGLWMCHTVMDVNCNYTNGLNFYCLISTFRCNILSFKWRFFYCLWSCLRKVTGELSVLARLSNFQLKSKQLTCHLTDGWPQQKKAPLLPNTQRFYLTTEVKEWKKQTTGAKVLHRLSSYTSN